MEFNLSRITWGRIFLATTIFLFSMAAPQVNGQSPLPEEKKKNIHKLDPADVFPLTEERSREREGIAREPETGRPAAIGGTSSTAKPSASAAQTRFQRGNSPQPMTASTPAPPANSQPVTGAVPQVSTASQAGSPGNQSNQYHKTAIEGASTAALAATTHQPDPFASNSSEQKSKPNGRGAFAAVLLLIGLVLTAIVFLAGKLIKVARA